MFGIFEESSEFKNDAGEWIRSLSFVSFGGRQSLPFEPDAEADFKTLVSVLQKGKQARNIWRHYD